MRKLYPRIAVFFILLFICIIPQKSISQVCASLVSSYNVTESRCAATGAIEITATGGSGSYQYKVSGPVSTNYTSINEITGLSAGTYSVTILDINTNCVYNQDSVFVPGNYITPGFSMISTNVSCPNGTDGTITVSGQSFGRAPFSYKIVAPSASAIGTVSAAGIFTGLISGDYSIQLTDSCGGIQTRLITLVDHNWHIDNYTVSKIGCDSIFVTLYLKDSYGNITPSSVFNGYSYGISLTPGDTTWFNSNSFGYFTGISHTATFFAKDLCGNIRSVVWIDNLVPNINASVAISNTACSTFTATITGQVNLTNPVFCIYDNINTLLFCNSTGVFDLLPYGSYCITTRDDCYDTTITRCFTSNKPFPSVAPNISVTSNCNSFTGTITGQLNLNNPYYCLYDSSDVLINCDSSGIFTDLPFGNYCIKISNDAACYDTTITRCFTVNPSIPAANPTVLINNLNCTGFTASVTDTSNWTDPQFCLYTATHVLVVCNSTGIFTGIPYGSYCIEIVNGPGCYDTTMSRCFRVSPPVPGVAIKPTFGNRTCTTFSATITGQTNLSNAEYCLYNSSNILMTCNATGSFTNLPYGSYCITIENDAACYDTTITKCFTVTRPIADITLSAKKSCIKIGGTDIKVTIAAGIPAYSLELFDPSGSLIQSATTSSGSYTFAGIANLPGEQYKVVITDQCGAKDSVLVTPVVSVVDRAITVNPKCPSSTLLTGYADVGIDITNNNIGGSISPKIIKKNGAAYSQNASSNIGYNYVFLGLAPATYIFDTYVNDCNTHLYDTVIIGTYRFPDLNGSRAYQCDNGSFVINVNAIYGVAPFQYEIFGSTPALPSIVTPPQVSPIFNINTGTSYSLIRLRVVDGCGNASLRDASVLPLASFYAFSDTIGCFNHNITLRVDSIANSTFTWYKRVPPNDSVVVGTNSTYFIPSIQQADTGRYVCKIVVYNGCVVRLANYVLTGYCGSVLPIDVNLSGFKQGDGNRLSWNNSHVGIRNYELQRSADMGAGYETLISYINGPLGEQVYTDINPFPGDNFYRLMVRETDGNTSFSNTIHIKNEEAATSIVVYPNPVTDMIYISLVNVNSKDHLIEINDLLGRKIYSERFEHVQNNRISIRRTPEMISGVYFLVIKDKEGRNLKSTKLVFRQ